MSLSIDDTDNEGLGLLDKIGSKQREDVPQAAMMGMRKKKGAVVAIVPDADEFLREFHLDEGDIDVHLDDLNSPSAAPPPPPPIPSAASKGTPSSNLSAPLPKKQASGASLPVSSSHLAPRSSSRLMIDTSPNFPNFPMPLVTSDAACQPPVPQPDFKLNSKPQGKAKTSGSKKKKPASKDPALSLAPPPPPTSDSTLPSLPQGSAVQPASLIDPTEQIPVSTLQADITREGEFHDEPMQGVLNHDGDLQQPGGGGGGGGGSNGDDNEEMEGVEVQLSNNQAPTLASGPPPPSPIPPIIPDPQLSPLPFPSPRDLLPSHHLESREINEAQIRPADYLSVIQTLELRIVEAQQMQDEAVDLSVHIAMANNKLLMVDNPVIRSNIKTIRAAAEELLRQIDEKR